MSVKGDSVTIDLPLPEILSASLDEEKTRVYDRDFSPLNDRPDDDLEEDARLQAVEKIEGAARENEILDTAEHNAEESVRALVTTLGFEESSSAKAPEQPSVCPKIGGVGLLVVSTWPARVLFRADPASIPFRMPPQGGCK